MYSRLRYAQKMRRLHIFCAKVNHAQFAAILMNLYLIGQTKNAAFYQDGVRKQWDERNLDFVSEHLEAINIDDVLTVE
jgi:hypothetical protein